MKKPVFDESLIEKGIEAGIEKGILKTAKRMIVKGWSVEDIIDATDLSKDVIQKLYENYCNENAEKSPAIQ